MTDAVQDLKDNPLLVSSGLPPFDRIRPEHVVPAVRHVLQESEARLTEIEQNIAPTWEATIEALDRIGCRFEYAWGPVSHLFGVRNSPELRTAYDEVLGEVVAWGLRVRQSEPVYRALKEIREGSTWETLSEVRQRIITERLRDAELAGIALTGADRKRFNEIAGELSRLQTEFSNHVLDATKAFALELTTAEEVDGLPPSLLQLAAQSWNMDRAASQEGITPAPAEQPQATPENGPWRITLDIPSFGPFMQHSRRPDLREQLYRAYLTRASSGDLDNCPVIDAILSLRQES
ncbi:MAG: M3 family peptidase, partial [Planctomycetaceae bacterium]|nr:M3 family peptidase [Planctomycetaceae bacterium]